jgi:hypothetical protein
MCFQSGLVRGVVLPNEPENHILVIGVENEYRLYRNYKYVISNKVLARILEHYYQLCADSLIEGWEEIEEITQNVFGYKVLITPTASA